MTQGKGYNFEYYAGGDYCNKVWRDASGEKHECGKLVGHKGDCKCFYCGALRGNLPARNPVDSIFHKPPTSEELRRIKL